jgi:hypothetical protein
LIAFGYSRSQYLSYVTFPLPDSLLGSGPTPASCCRTTPGCDAVSGLTRSHLAALGNDNIEVRHVLAAVARLSGLHLADDVHAAVDFAEDDVLVVKEGGRDSGDEELGSVGVGTGVLGLC